MFFSLFNCQTPEEVHLLRPSFGTMIEKSAGVFNRLMLPSLTVSKTKNRCKPYDYWAAAIFVVVADYSNLFFSFTFFLNGSHTAFGYELIIRSETTGFMEIIRDKFPSV